MTSRHLRTLEAVFADPVRANIAWHDIESLMVALGGRIVEGSGSRVWVVLNDVPAVFHRPHPGKEATKPMVRSVRDFILNAGVTRP